MRTNAGAVTKGSAYLEQISIRRAIRTKPLQGDPSPEMRSYEDIRKAAALGRLDTTRPNVDATDV
jgi:hypothetical protein